MVGVPLLLVMVLFALSNREPVRLGLFPLGRLPFELPLSVVILAAMGLGFFLGGLRLWFTALQHRRAARRAEAAVRLLEAKHQELKARASGPGLTHAGGASRA
jgi:lipopolysaccharide assembly protein A